MAGWEILQDFGLFQYEQSAIDLVSDYVARSSNLPKHGSSTDPDWYRDYLMICCAETAVGTASLLPDRKRDDRQSFSVDASVARLGLAKSNTDYFTCGLAESLETASLWDLVMFGGDMCKLSYLGVNSAQQLYENIDSVLSQLRTGYEEAETILGYSPVSAHHLIASGACWIGKGACIARDDSAVRIRNFLEGVLA